MQKFILILHRAAAYYHSTVYCSKVSVMPNYKLNGLCSDWLLELFGKKCAVQAS